MLRFNVFKVKEGKLETLREWGKVLASRTAEVHATLDHEHVASEVLHLFETPCGTYAVGMQSLTGPHVKADAAVELNRRHMDVMRECLEPVRGENAYAFLRDVA